MGIGNTIKITIAAFIAGGILASIIFLFIAGIIIFIIVKRS